MTAEIPEYGQPLDGDFIQKVSSLAATADVLSKEIPDLAAAVRRKIRILTTGFVLLLVALAVSSYALYEEHRTNDDLKATIVSVRNVVTTETRTNNQVLCPLYAAFVDSFTPEQRAKQPINTLPFYDRAVAAIRRAYTTLGCPPGTVP